MSITVLTLIVGLIIFSNIPSVSYKKAMLSSPLIPVYGLSLSYNEQVNQAQYYKTQFKIDKSQFKKAPEFMQVTGYVNTNPIKLSELRGKVVLVHFWTYTCINCIHTIPHLNDWYAKYASKGFIIVGIQTPEFEYEKNIDSVKKAVNDFKIKYPIIQDNNLGTWNAYGNRYWPRDYLVDNEGYIRYSHIGEGGYYETENMIKSLLAELKTNYNVN